MPKLDRLSVLAIVVAAAAGVVIAYQSDSSGKREPPGKDRPAPTQMGVPNLAATKRLACSGSVPAKPGELVVFAVGLDGGTGHRDTKYEVRVAKGGQCLVAWSKIVEVDVRVEDDQNVHKFFTVCFEVDPSWKSPDGENLTVEFGVFQQGTNNGFSGAKFEVAPQ